MDHIHEAFTELDILGIIISSTSNMIMLDLKKLYALGYVLIFNVSTVTFVTLEDFSYMYNPIIYSSNVVPRTALNSFVLSKIKNSKISP